jgi:hypothetical protein
MKNVSSREPLGVFAPEVVHTLGEIVDEIWACLSPEIGKSRDHIEFARDHLALTVADLAKDGQLNRLQITRTAARLMRERCLPATSTAPLSTHQVAGTASPSTTQ